MYKRIVLTILIYISISSNSFAEIIEISSGVKIKIPANKTFYTSDPLVDLKNNMIARKFTDKEMKYSLKEVKRMGFSGKELGYSIVTKTAKKNRLRKNDEFEKLEYDVDQQDFVFSKCSDKKTKKSQKECIIRSLLEFDDNFEYFYTHIGDNVSQKLQLLNGMSDDQLASLTKKEIKKIRKISSSKINYKYKKRYFKEKGIRNIKITPDGFFYIESISSIKHKNGYNYTETSWAIPYDNREFLIKSNCYKEYCQNTKQRMYEIIEPTFSINLDGIKTYDFQKKQDMLDLIQNVRNGYRIFRIASLMFGVIV